MTEDILDENFYWVAVHRGFLEMFPGNTFIV